MGDVNMNFNHSANKLLLWVVEENDRENQSPAYVVLLDEKIYCKCNTKYEIYDKGLCYGCFVDAIPYSNKYEMKDDLEEMKNGYSLEEVEVDEFQRIEKEKQKERVAKAFKTAEKMISDDEEWEM